MPRSVKRPAGRRRRAVAPTRPDLKLKQPLQVVEALDVAADFFHLAARAAFIAVGGRWPGDQESFDDAIGDFVLQSLDDFESRLLSSAPLAAPLSPGRIDSCLLRIHLVVRDIDFACWAEADGMYQREPSTHQQVVA